MTRKVMRELSEMMNYKEHQEIDDRLLQQAIRERAVRDYFNKKIYEYLRIHHKGIGEIDRDDLAEMTKGLTARQSQVYLEQVMKAMQTNRGKPIKRIREHNKSVLLNQLD